MKITTTHLAKSYLEAVEDKNEKEVKLIAKRFVALLIKRRLIKGKRAIVEAIVNLRDEMQSHKSVTVTSANSLTTEQKNQIESSVKESHNVANVTLINIVDEELLGGMDVQIGWEKVTNSLKQRIETLKKAV